MGNKETRTWKKVRIKRMGKWLDTVGIVDDYFICEDPSCKKRVVRNKGHRPASVKMFCNFHSQQHKNDQKRRK